MSIESPTDRAYRVCIEQSDVLLAGPFPYTPLSTHVTEYGGPGGEGAFRRGYWGAAKGHWDRTSLAAACFRAGRDLRFKHDSDQWPKEN